MPVTTWLARCRSTDSGERYCVRIQNSGALPKPEDTVEVIVDPFSDPDGDALAKLRDATAIRTFSLDEWMKDHAFVPAVRPGKILGIGRNYGAHAKEMGNDVPTSPLLFLMPATALAVSGDAVGLPSGYERIDMEAELVVVIGRSGSQIHRTRAWEHVGGLMLGNDISCRDLQKQEPQWARAKGMDGFAPISPWIRIGDVAPPPTLRIVGELDDQIVQNAPISDMIFGIPELIEFISQTMRLECGDLIFTGTPAGVSALRPGSRVCIRAEGLELAPVVTLFCERNES